MICIEFHGAVPDSEWDRYLAWNQAIQDRAAAAGDKLVMVVDATPATRAATARQRKLQAEQMEANAGRGIIIGLAAVIDSAIVRGAMTALLWIQRMPWDYTVVATREKAEHWALDKLAAERQVSNTIDIGHTGRISRGSAGAQPRGRPRPEHG